MFALIGLSLFFNGNDIHVMDFYDTHLNDICVFQNRLTESIDHLTLSLFQQEKRQRK